MNGFLYENHRGGITLTLLNVLGLLGMLNVPDMLGMLNVLNVLYVINMSIAQGRIIGLLGHVVFRNTKRHFVYYGLYSVQVLNG